MMCNTCGVYAEVTTHKCNKDRAWAFSKTVIGTMEENKKDTNPKDAAATTRLDFSAWPETASAYGALAMTEGAYKYGAYNYRVAGVQASVYVSALRRHMAKWYNGEDYDPITGVPHLANALACIGVLIDAIEANALVDDRPPKTDMGRLLKEFEARVKKLQEIFPPAKGPGRYTEIKDGKTNKLV